jgi:hypothetical protein
MGQSLCASIDSQFRELAEWWRQFAAHECTSIQCPDPQDIVRGFQAGCHGTRDVAPRRGIGR